MPFLEVNGAQIHYETFGDDRPDRAPIVLIHGSTGAGHSNWNLVAPLLVRGTAIWFAVVTGWYNQASEEARICRDEERYCRKWQKAKQEAQIAGALYRG